MNMLNSLLIEGVMTAGLTLDGRFTIETSRYEGREETKNVFLCKLMSALLEVESVRGMFKNGNRFRLVGYLSKYTDGQAMIMVEHVERIGVRSGKYNFAIEK